MMLHDPNRKPAFFKMYRIMDLLNPEQGIGLNSRYCHGVPDNEGVNGR
jgi:hypothetical protein